MSNIKGTAWLAVCDYIQKMAGQQGMAKIMAALDLPDREQLSKQILPMHWIDYGAYMRFMIMADKLLGKGDLQFFKDAAAHTAEKDLKGIYRVFIRLATPKFLFSKGLGLWRAYYDRGVVTTHFDSPKSGRVEISNFPDIPLYHEIENIPYLEVALKICGAKNVRITHPQCIARGDAICIYQGDWD